MVLSFRSFLGTNYSPDRPHIDPKELKKWLQEVTQTPFWSPDTCIASFPSSDSSQGIDRFHTMLGETKNHKTNLQKPLPVDSEPIDRVKEMRTGRRESCLYDEMMQKKNLKQTRQNIDMTEHPYSLDDSKHKASDLKLSNSNLNRSKALPLEKTKEKPTARYTEEYCQCILVTGGVGFVGSHIAKALLKEGRKVVAYDIFNSETTVSAEKEGNAEILVKTAAQYSDLGAAVDIVHGDIRNQEKITETVLKFGVTGAIHVGGMVDDRRSVTHPEEYVDINIKGTAMLLDALGKCGIKMVVQASTRSDFGQREDNDIFLDEFANRRPINPYGASKVGSDAMGHYYSHLHNMNLSLVHIFATYRPRQRPDIIPRILIKNTETTDDKPIRRKVRKGDATCTWIYISDIVSAFLMALKNPQGGYAEFNTVASNLTILNELIECADEVTGKKAIINHYPVSPGDAHTVGHPSYGKIRRARPIYD